MRIIRAEIITIGDEILYGHILDTNSQWMAARLSELGIKVTKIISISDTREAILQTVRQSDADLQLITGGLGPTKDDVTKTTLCEFTQDELQIHPVAEAHVRELFESRGLPFTEINRLQAAIPSKCEYLHNATGTAPGMWFNHQNRIIVSLPGVPVEMKYLMSEEVIPKVKERLNPALLAHAYLKTVGIGESFLAEKIAHWEESLPEDMKLAYLPDLAEVKLRLSSLGGHTEEELQRKFEEIIPLIDAFVYAKEDITLEKCIGELLLEQNATLSTAESCTGGNIAHHITKVAGSASYFLGSVVSYANSVKLDILKVKSETLSNFGAVSEETVTEMALGVQRLTGSTYAIATSGIAGPGGGTPGKPVGTIWMAVTNGNETITKKLNLKRDRLGNIEYTTKAALNLLRLQLRGIWQK